MGGEEGVLTVLIVGIVLGFCGSLFVDGVGGLLDMACPAMSTRLKALWTSFLTRF